MTGLIQSKRITGLIGFGVEEKRNLVRGWIDNLLSDNALPQPDGIFWWGFHDRPSVDEFLEAALNYLSGGNSNPAYLYPSSSERVQLLAGMLHRGRYLFILDGLEIWQHQDGDRFGLLNSNDLREFLQFFAAPDHDSFCIVTSCIPLLDLMEYATYQHRDVENLSINDNRSILRRFGMQASNATLSKVKEDLYGDALTPKHIRGRTPVNYDDDVKSLRPLNGKMNRRTNRRSRFEIVSQILNICKNGASKTRIVYQSNLNFRTVNPYLELLIKNELIEVKYGPQMIYETTERGTILLEKSNQKKFMRLQL